MKTSMFPVFLIILLALPGCSSEMAKRAAYDSIKNKSEMDCRSEPGASCPEPRSYDDYQRDLKQR